MNPKVTISIDAKNKAVASVTGMLTVGAKVDVDVTGLPSDIPDWATSDAFTGASVRFRLVDEMGHDLARFPRVATDAWTKTTATETTPETYSATNVELDTAPLRMRFDCVPFNEKIELGIIFDSAVDDAQYAIGKVKVAQWAQASTEDPQVLPDWREVLATLKLDLAAVNTSKTAAQAAADAASQSASSASASASTAQESAGAALSSANAAQAASARYPRVGATGNWELWNVATQQYEDSGRSAIGMSSYFYDASTQKYHQVQIAKNARGEFVVSVDQTGTATPTEVYAKDAAVVHLAGAETITGEKTFMQNIVSKRTGNYAIFRNQFTGLTRGTIPSESKTVEMRLEDGDGNTLTDIIQSVYKNTGTREIIIRAIDDVGSGVNLAAMGYKTDGSVYAKGTALAAVGFPSTSTTTPAAWPKSNGYVNFGTTESPVEQAPYNGWLLVSATATNGQYVMAKTGFARNDGGAISNVTGIIKSSDGTINMPVTKGMYVQISYTTTANPSIFKFVKAMAEV